MHSLAHLSQNTVLFSKLLQLDKPLQDGKKLHRIFQWKCRGQIHLNSCLGLPGRHENSKSDHLRRRVIPLQWLSNPLRQTGRTAKLKTFNENISNFLHGAFYRLHHAVAAVEATSAVSSYFRFSCRLRLGNHFQVFDAL
eukprot:m.311865 g.311865  ORF g.311865 m.311865 type:complete len:139 (+) comp165185_c0_seq1:252-668(+)